MKQELALLLCSIFISFSLIKPSDATIQKNANISIDENSNNTILDVVSNYTGDAASIALDFIPYIGNVKNLGEAIFGKDLVTGKVLTNSERILSLVGAIPFANYLKGGKYFKNGQKFLKASQRAFKGGKMINGIKFAKAASRALSKPNVLQKIAKAGNFVAKTAKSVSKIVRNKKQLRL